MNILRLHLRNLKGFPSYTVRLGRVNILTGPNNAGKSTVLDALRLLDGVVRFAQRRNPSPVRGPTGVAVTGYDVPATSLPIALTNIHHNYSEEAVTIEYELEGGKKVGIIIREAASCVFYLDAADSIIQNTTAFKHRYPLSLAVVPTLGPFESPSGKRLSGISGLGIPQGVTPRGTPDALDRCRPSAVCPAGRALRNRPDG